MRRVQNTYSAKKRESTQGVQTSTKMPPGECQYSAVNANGRLWNNPGCRLHLYSFQTKILLRPTYCQLKFHQTLSRTAVEHKSKLKRPHQLAASHKHSVDNNTAQWSMYELSRQQEMR